MKRCNCAAILHATTMTAAAFFPSLWAQVGFCLGRSMLKETDAFSEYHPATSLKSDFPRSSSVCGHNKSLFCRVMDRLQKGLDSAGILLIDNKSRFRRKQGSKTPVKEQPNVQEREIMNYTWSTLIDNSPLCHI